MFLKTYYLTFLFPLLSTRVLSQTATVTVTIYDLGYDGSYASVIRADATATTYLEECAPIGCGSRASARVTFVGGPSTAAITSEVPQTTYEYECDVTSSQPRPTGTCTYRANVDGTKYSSTFPLGKGTTELATQYATVYVTAGLEKLKTDGPKPTGAASNLRGDALAGFVGMAILGAL